MWLHVSSYSKWMDVSENGFISIQKMQIHSHEIHEHQSFSLGISNYYQKLALIQTCAEFRADFEIQRIDQVFILC